MSKYKNKHFYKIPKESERGKALTEFMRQCHEADVKADAWAAEHHATEYIEPIVTFAGGVSAVVFPKGYTPDANEWRMLRTDNGDELWVPNVPDTFDLTDAKRRRDEGEELTKGELLEISRMELPMMQIGHFFSVLPYKADIPVRINLQTSPVVYQRKGYWFVAVPVILQPQDNLFAIHERTFYRNRMSALNES